MVRKIAGKLQEMTPNTGRDLESTRSKGISVLFRNTSSAALFGSWFQEVQMNDSKILKDHTVSVRC